MGNSLSSYYEAVVLPDEILIKIFLQLSLEDLFFSIPTTCKNFNRVSQDNSIWIRLAHSNWKNEKNIKGAYLKWVREQVDNFLHNKNNWFTSGRGTSWEGMLLRQNKSINSKEVRVFDFMQKILFVGEMGSGKTSLIYRYTDDVYNSEHINTIGIDFRCKTIQLEARKKLKLKLQIWDSGNGRDRFRPISSAYYRGADGLCIIFDITNRLSFTHVANYLAEIAKYSQKNLPKVLIGNKCDLESKRAVTTKEATIFAAENNMQYVEVSAKDNINVSKTFTNFATLISDGYYDGVIPNVTPLISFFATHFAKSFKIDDKKKKSSIVCSIQ